MQVLNNKNDVTKLLEQYENFYIFVQKSNDLDTLASGLGLCHLIKLNLPNAKKIKILGVRLKDSFIKIADKDWKNYLSTKEQDSDIYEVVPPKTIGITVDINSPSELLVINRILLNKVDCILKIDHHKEQFDFFRKNCLEDKQKENFFEYTEFLTSCSEVIWRIAKECNWKTNKQIAEILSVGLISENSFIMNRETTPDTYRNYADLMDEGADVTKIKSEMWSIEKKQWLLISRLIQSTVWEGNLVCLNLTPEIAYEYYPQLFKQDPNRKGMIIQKTLLTFPLKILDKTLKANNIIYIHYSVFKPFKDSKKYVFFINKSKDPEIRRILLENGFKQNRERFSKPSTQPEITSFLNKYYDILSK